MEDNSIDPQQTSVNISKKSTSIIVLAVLLSIALSFWIYYAQKQKNQPSRVNNIIQTDTSPDLTFLDTAEWKGFAGIGYAAKYPAELNTKSSELKTSVTLDTWSPPNTGYSIFIVSNPKNVNPNIKFVTKGDVVKQITVAGQLTNRIMGYSNTGTVIHVGPITIKNTQYLLIYDSGKNKATPESIQIFDTMVSTFTPGK
ncbi:MAG: hypothetical protein WAV51_00505 [Microgenomates group bacterium]